GRWDDVVVIFRLLKKDHSLEVFERLEAGMQEKLVQSFTHEKANEIFERMEPDDRVRMLDELPAKVTKRLLDSLTKDERNKTALLLGYPAQTAGRIMTPEYVSLKEDMTKEQALEWVSAQRKSAETVYVLYVTDASRKLLGVLSLGDLVSAAKDARIRDIMSTQVLKVRTHTDQEKVAEMLKDKDLLAVPVVDQENRLVGIVTVDDAMDIMEQETTEDMFKKAGIGSMIYKREETRSTGLISGSVWHVWKVRLPYLIITLMGGMLAGGVIDAFEETLEAVVALAIFIPVIMDMGGNVGTQSSTIFTRAFVLGHINMSRFIRHFRREVSIGAGMGVFLGVAAMLIAIVWQGIPELGYAVGLSLFLTVTLATALGFLTPYVLIRMGLDQAAGSDPIITTVKDISGLAIYFTTASIFLSAWLN
ncbi:magnesium transporter, partial [Desulfonatronospira sp.]|uniref:magnesium transporter n=1 Tax=Desulfonatronospira sp. TaxID=1962951 RepID=UPI0025C3F46A